MDLQLLKAVQECESISFFFHDSLEDMNSVMKNAHEMSCAQISRQIFHLDPADVKFHSLPIRQNSGTTTPRVRAPATTLNIPGMTRSRVSPDGKIAQRDVASKLVVIMVGLPARGKSYITKKIQRYLSWQQHETRIFNVGNRRRVAAGKPQQKNATPPTAQTEAPTHRSSLQSQPIRTGSIPGIIDAPTQAAHMILNGVDPTQQEQETKGLDLKKVSSPGELPDPETMDQSASFFNPLNSKAALIREQVAMATLDELLDFLLLKNGAVGILDATNSTIERRSLLFKHVKEREPKLGILFIESVCEDESVRISYIHGFFLLLIIVLATRGKHAIEAPRTRLQRQGSRVLFERLQETC